MASDDRPVVAGVISTGYSTFDLNTNTKAVLGYAFPVEKVREILVEFGMRWVPLNYGASEERNFEFIGSLVDDFMKGDEA